MNNKKLVFFVLALGTVFCLIGAVGGQAQLPNSSSSRVSVVTSPGPLRISGIQGANVGIYSTAPHPGLRVLSAEQGNSFDGSRQPSYEEGNVPDSMFRDPSMAQWYSTQNADNGYYRSDFYTNDGGFIEPAYDKYNWPLASGGFYTPAFNSNLGQFGAPAFSGYTDYAQSRGPGGFYNPAFNNNIGSFEAPVIPMYYWSQNSNRGFASPSIGYNVNSDPVSSSYVFWGYEY